MQETEVKARINDLDGIKRKLCEMGCVFEESVHQYDQVFLDNKTEYEKFHPGTVVARIRTQGKSNILNIKKHITNELDCIEEEVEIANPIEMGKILNLVGFEKKIEVEKDRCSSRYENYTILIDEVKYLGNFIEIEYLNNTEKEGAVIQENLTLLLERLGIEKRDIITVGYDTLIYRNKSNVD
jgi:predicted adenylyl cyclase CyaB